MFYKPIYQNTLYCILYFIVVLYHVYLASYNTSVQYGQKCGFYAGYHSPQEPKNGAYYTSRQSNKYSETVLKGHLKTTECIYMTGVPSYRFINNMGRQDTVLRNDGVLGLFCAHCLG